MQAPRSIASRFHARVTVPARASAMAATMALSLPALAQEDTQSSWGLGVGVSSGQTAYRGVDRDNAGFPLIQYENRYVEVFGPRVGLKLPGWRISDSQQLKFSLVGQYDLGGGYDAGDSPVFSGMAERKRSFWLGGKVEWENALVNVSAELLGDASGHSEGRLFSLGLDRTWRVGQQWMLTPRVVATWQDSKYVDYYYGVRADEATAGRSAYRGESGVNAEVGLRAMYMIDRNQSVFADVGVSRLNSSIRNSPLVDRSTENHLFLGYLYRFR
ncbi:MAG: MipA/OmpV family protein [Hydrogenophaga sp.]|nr:MipA/OmpV family protein [Hydrogenophaga sp.]